MALYFAYYVPRINKQNVNKWSNNKEVERGSISKNVLKRKDLLELDY